MKIQSTLGILEVAIHKYNKYRLRFQKTKWLHCIP